MPTYQALKTHTVPVLDSDGNPVLNQEGRPELRLIRRGQTFTEDQVDRSRSSLYEQVAEQGPEPDPEMKTPEPTTAEVRAWAQRNGYEVSPRGRLPDDVVEAYMAAHKDE